MSSSYYTHQMSHNITPFVLLVSVRFHEIINSKALYHTLIFIILLPPIKMQAHRKKSSTLTSREMWKSKAFPFISGGSLGGPLIGQPYPIHRLGNPAARHVESHEQTWVEPRTNGKQLPFLFCFK